jgi:hypothetical protein
MGCCGVSALQAQVCAALQAAQVCAAQGGGTLAVGCGFWSEACVCVCVLMARRVDALGET